MPRTALDEFLDGLKDDRDRDHETFVGALSKENREYRSRIVAWRPVLQDALAYGRLYSRWAANGFPSRGPLYAECDAAWEKVKAGLAKIQGTL